MSIEITSWLRAYFALQEHARDVRGCVEIIGEDDEVIRWPRTRGADVVAIATLFAECAQAEWRGCVDDIGRFARPTDEYANNRAFWRALLGLCVYLHAQHVPLPATTTWTTLFAQF